MVAAAAVLLTAAGLRLYKKGADMRETAQR